MSHSTDQEEELPGQPGGSFFSHVEENETPGQLTDFPVGTMRELLTLAYPIMISLLSVGCMILANRVFLAKYSLDAFNAVSEAVTLFTPFEFTIVTLATVAEVLVGRAFGGKEYHKVAKPVWAMAWMSIGTAIIFFPLSMFCTDFIFASSPNKELASSYFSILSFFGPLFPLNAALGSFWIGRGKTAFVTMLTAVVSIFNIAIDPILIFGFGPIPELGCAGAAIARGLSQLILAGMLFVAFLAKPNRRLFKTSNWKFDFSAFKQMLSYGSSPALSQLVQCGAWAIFFRIMGIASQGHILACGISDAIYFFFHFAIEGISKAVSSVVANLIGAGRINEIGFVAATGLKLVFYFAVALGLCLFPAPDAILSLFLPHDMAITTETWGILRSCLFWIWLTLIGETLLFLWSGILMAFGDTRFILVTSAVFVWVMGVLPAYVTTLHWKMPAHIGLAVACTYYFFAGFAYMLRVRHRLIASKQLVRA